VLVIPRSVERSATGRRGTGCTSHDIVMEVDDAVEGQAATQSSTHHVASADDRITWICADRPPFPLSVRSSVYVVSLQPALTRRGAVSAAADDRCSTAQFPPTRPPRRPPAGPPRALAPPVPLCFRPHPSESSARRC